MHPEQAPQAAEDLRARALMQARVGRFSIAPHDWDEPFKRPATASRGREHVLWTPEIGQPVYLDGREFAVRVHGYEQGVDNGSAKFWCEA